MAGNDDGAYSGPLSPEEKAECDREMEEMRRQNFEQLRRDIDEDIKRSIDQSIDQYIKDRIFSVMD